jgi:hypothetical protein
MEVLRAVSTKNRQWTRPFIVVKLHRAINVAQSRARSRARKREQKTRVETALKLRAHLVQNVSLWRCSALMGGVARLTATETKTLNMHSCEVVTSAVGTIFSL